MSAAVVTGGASGIGRACVELFAEEGWDVLAVDVEPGPQPPIAGSTHVVADVTDEERMAEVVTEFADRLGGVDALVNSAAVQVTGGTLERSAAEWQRVMDVNVRAVAIMTAACRAHLAASGGSVVNVSSVHARATSPEIGVYAASKGAVSALTRALAVELAPEAIRVNAVLPGAVDTPMLRAGLGRGHRDEERALQELATRTVLGRIGRPAEIARAVFFLACADQSSFITGAEVVVDGGACARLSTE